MLFSVMRSVLVGGAFLATDVTLAPAALAQDLKARCDQLVSYYARYGTSRGEDTDGSRNVIRLGAEVDCRDGRFEKGVAAMERLMKAKNWTVPPPS